MRRQHASRVLASVLFWIVPMLGGVAFAALATYALDMYDRNLGRSTSFGIAFMIAVVPSSVNAAAYGFVLATFPPIALQSASRLYLLSALLSVPALLLSLGLATAVYNAFFDADAGTFLVVPVFVTAVLTALILAGLLRLGWLVALTPGACPRCGYDTRGSRPGLCPECGYADPRPPGPDAGGPPSP